MWEDKKRRRQETQSALQTMPLALMKNCDGSTGIGSLKCGKYRVVKTGDRAKDVMVFDSIEQLSDAGWTITT